MWVNGYVVFMRYITIIFLILLTTNVRAANYYFSSQAGDDSRSSSQAQNALTPWKTLNKLNSFISNLQPGDSVLFKRGETFYGSIKVNKSGSPSLPFVFSAYGTGEKPIISGLTSLTGWVNLGNGIWESSPCIAAGAKINVLLLNGSEVPMGRYPNLDAPNKGFLTYSSHNGNTSISDNTLNASPNWTGATLVVRKERWTFDRSLITSHSGPTLTYTAQTSYSPTDGFGYFIENNINTLDEVGEWYYNPATKKVDMYFGNNAPPANIQVSTVDNLAFLKYYDNISFNNISFKGSNLNMFELGGQQNITINNCDLQYAGIDAVYGFSLTNFTIVNSSITNANNNAIFMAYNCKLNTIKNNTIRKTGLSMGMGDAVNYNTLSGISTGGAGVNSCPNTTIEGNVIDSTGYNAVSFVGDNTIIKNNFITNFCITKDDGGGIYTNKGTSDTYVYSGSQVTGNIILNGQSSPQGTANPSQSLTWGIYLDDNSQGITITGNTAANMPNGGIFLHNAHDIKVQQNTLYNNAVQLQLTHDNSVNSALYNNTITGNVLFAKLGSQLSGQYGTINNDIPNFGNFDQNYYDRPLDNSLVINTRQFINSTNASNVSMSLSSWKSVFTKDLNSTPPVLKIPPYIVNQVTGSNLFANGTFNSNISGAGAYSAAGNFGIAWDGNTLDGGTLKSSFNSVSLNPGFGSVSINIGAVTAGKTYRLKFSMLGSNNNTAITTYLRKTTSGYNDLSQRLAVTLTGTRQENEFIFAATASDSNASILFDIPEQSSAVYFDNIQFDIVDATQTDPNKYISFFYNNTYAAKTFALAAAGTDVFGNNYKDTVTIQPFQSAVIVSNLVDCPVPIAKPVIVSAQ